MPGLPETSCRDLPFQPTLPRYEFSADPLRIEETTMTIDVETQLHNPLDYRTTSRGLAAALMALGFALKDLEHGDREASFTFSISRMLLNAADAYFLDTLSVSAFRMGQAVEQLDDMIAGHTADGEVDFDDL